MYKYIIFFIAGVVINSITISTKGDETRTDYALISKLEERSVINEDYALPPKVVFFQSNTDIEGYFKFIPDYKNQIKKHNDTEISYYNLAQLEGAKFTSEELKNIQLFLVDKNGIDILVKYEIISEPVTRDQGDDFYRFKISTNALPIGSYKLKIKINGIREIIHLTNKTGMPTDNIIIRCIETEKDQELAILLQIDSVKRNKGILEIENHVNDLLINKKSSIKSSRFDIASYLCMIAMEKDVKIDVVAWGLLFNRFGTGGDIGSYVLKYGGWEKALRDEDEIEKTAAKFKEKYFPDLKYVYSVQKLNLTKIFADKDKMQRGRDREEDEERMRSRSDNHKPEQHNDQKISTHVIQADFVISAAADGTIFSGSKKLKIEDIQSFLKESNANKGSKVLIVGEETCDLTLIQSVIEEVKKIGIESIEFTLKNE